MNAKKTLKKYVGAPKWMKPVRWACLALAIVGILMCTVFKGNDDPETAKAFNPIGSGDLEYSYLDIVGISDWAYKVTSDNTTTVYYFAEDAEGYMYTVSFVSGNHDLDKMADQKVYWEREDENEPQPDAYRVYGKPVKLSGDVKEGLAEYWEISEEDFELYFGDRRLSIGASAAEAATAPWIIAIMLGSIAWLALLASGAAINSNMKKCFKSLESRGQLEAAAAELEAENTVDVAGGNGKVSENFVFGRKTGSVLSLGEIVWCYTQVMANRGAVTKTSIIANTKGRKNISVMNLGALGYNEEAAKVFEAVSARNPSALIGMSRENRQAYKQICK